MTPPVFPTNSPANTRLSAAFPWSVVITIFLITTIIATAVTFILPESYASTARIKLDMSAGGTNTPASYDPNFLQTEFEVIQSQAVLSRVIETLGLNIEWGKKYFNGEQLKTVESLEILKGRLSLAPVRGTRLVAITCYSDDPREAAMMANAVVDAYVEYAAGKSYPAHAVEIMDRAEPARQPSKPNKPLNITLGAVFGALAGLAAAALVWALNSRRR